MFVDKGLGRHIYCLSPEQISRAIMWSVLSQLFNFVGIGLAKVSVCLCVLRILNRTRKGLTKLLWVLIFFVSISHLCECVLFIVQCRPMPKMWNPHIKGKCFSPHITYQVGYFSFALDALTDILCAGIPIVLFQRLQMNARTKLALRCLMGLGALTSVCSIAKAVTLKGVFVADYTWELKKPAICATTEHYSSLTLASLPALKPLFQKIMGAVRDISSTYSEKRRRGRDPGSEDSSAFEKPLEKIYTERLGSDTFDRNITFTTHIHTTYSA